MPSIPIDDDMVEKIRFIAGRTGRDLSRTLREAIDAAYDLERQEQGDEIQTAGFLHAVNEDDPVDWEKVRAAEAAQRGRWPCRLKALRADTVPVTVEIDADVYEWIQRRLFGPAPWSWPDVSAAVNSIVHALSGLGEGALIDLLDGLERDGKTTVARALFGQVSPHCREAVNALVIAAEIAARHGPDDIAGNLPYNAALRAAVLKIIAAAGADKFDPHVPVQQP